MRPAALVTGSARRLGKHIALHLAQNGYDIALHYNSSEKEAQQTAKEIEQLGVRCATFQADLADKTSYSGLIDEVCGALNGLNVLVNSAAVFDRGTFLDSDLALFEKEHTINLIAPVFLTQAFAKKRKTGCVVNLIDASVSQNSHAFFYYLMSKKSLLEFTRMAAAELAPDIRVNGVCPGYVLPAPGFGDEYKAKLEKKLPMKKIATPEAIAQAVLLMVSNPSLTGQIMYVDGGESLL